MRMKRMEKPYFMNRFARIGLILMLTMAVTAIMPQGWSSPVNAEAAIAELNAWPATPQINNVTASPATTSFTPAAGSNRIMVISIHAHTNNTTVTTITANYGGVAGRAIVNSPNNQRRQNWLFYWNEADIAAASGTTVTVTSNNVGSGLSAYVATLSGVDQASPIVGSYQIYSLTLSYSFNVPAGGYAMLMSVDNTATDPTNDEGYTGSTSTLVGASYSYLASKLFASAATTSPVYTTDAGFQSFAAFALNPVLCSDTNGSAVSITNPANASTVGGSVSITANLTNAATAEYSIAGGAWTPIATAWNTLSTHPGSSSAPVSGVTVAVRAIEDECGGFVNHQVTVTVDNTVPPTLPSTISSCSGCHQYSPTFADGTARNTPMGQFLGSHNAHVINYNCSICHVAPATTNPADFPHRDGTITMVAGATSISGGYYDKNNNSSYNAGLDNTFAQSNSPVLASCRNVACHSTGIAGATMAAPTWGGGPANCTWCHGDPPTTSPLYNHAGVSAGVCASCHGHDGSGANHANGTLDGTFTCVGCHASAQGTRAAVVGEFGMAWGHKKSGRAAVADADCIVCHLEGVYATQSRSATYHADGNIDLRDPDGVGEARITNNSGAAFTFAQYSVSYAAGSRTTTLGNTIAEVVTVKFCMKCHDANGATNTTARSNNGGTGTAMMPFGGINLGANYTTANGAAAAGGVVDVAKQFLSTNSSRHPVGAPNNRAYPFSTRLAAPYNGLGTARNANLTTGTAASPRVKANSVIMVCDDCHTTGTSLTTRTITAHGSASQIRGTFFVASPTLCTTCHIGVYADNTNGRHNSGSAFAVGTTRANGAMLQCHFCHFSQNEPYAAASRPRYAQDVHGFNELQGTSAGWTAGTANGMRPIAFMRSWATSGGSWPTTASPRPYTATLAGPGQFNLAAGQPQCGGTFAFNGTGTSPAISCSSNGHTNYSPGGSY